MNKLKILIVLIFVFVIICFGIFFLNMQVVDTEYSIRYGEVLNSYNISEVDEFLDRDTKITYGNQTKTYQELRHNVISAFEDKKFTISSYGHGDNLFIGATQNVGIQSYVELESRGSTEVYIEMVIKKTLINGYFIESLSSDDDFFGYLFFGFPIKE